MSFAGRPFKKKYIKTLESWVHITPGARLHKSNEIMAELLRHQVDAVSRCRSDGESWQQIGDHLGISKQAAQQFFGPRIDLDLR